MSSVAPIEAAGAVLLDEAGRMLLVREVAEETGLDVRVDELVGSYALADSTLTAHLFRCTIVAGSPAVPASGEIAELRWFPPDELPSPRTNLLHHALPDVLAGRTGVERRGLSRVT